MKVLHAAAEIAGQASILCRGLRALGVDATAAIDDITKG